jgi:hypothetical protein
VTSFLRFFNAVLTGVTLAAVLGLAGAATSWQANNQRMGWLLEQLSQEVKENNQTNKTQEDKITEIRVQQRVAEEINRNHNWRINRLEQRSGLTR